MAPLKIAIIGAGPGGCMLARILTQSKVAGSLSVTIYEGETAPNVRSQGGTLDLHRGSGLDAIAAGNLEAEFDEYARYDGQNLIISDKHLLKWIHDNSHTTNEKKSNDRAPEIDRFRLRQILLESLPSGTVQWGRRLAEVVKEEQGGCHTLKFRDESVVSGIDLVVGADGAWSKVRPVLSNAQPQSCGSAGLSFTIGNASKVAPEVVKLINRGNIFSSHDQMFLAHQQMGDDYIQINFMYKNADPDWVKNSPFDCTDVEAVKTFVLGKLEGWDPLLTSAIRNCSKENTMCGPWRFCQLPANFKWDHQKGVTLMGDASHVTFPNGNGVNAALDDAVKLATELTGAISTAEKCSPDILDGAVARYETAKFPRMATNFKLATNMQNTFFLPGGFKKNMETVLLTMLSDEVPYWTFTKPFVAVAVYIYFFFFRLRNKPKD